MSNNLNRVREILGLPASRKRSVESHLVTITPEMAHQLLPLHQNVRRLRQATVENYALDMIRGHWPVTGDSLAYNTDGIGDNGEHRLAACVKAGVPFRTFVTLGTEPEAVLDMDRGAKRDLAGFLQSKLGITNASDVASGLRNAFQLVENKEVTQSTVGLSHEQLYGWYLDGHETIVDDVEAVKIHKSGWPQGFTVSHAAGILHACRFIDGVDYFKAARFFGAMAQAEDLVGLRSAPNVLRTTFETLRRQSRSGRIQIPVSIGSAIKALNMFLVDEEVPVNEAGTPKAGYLIWRPGPGITFPQITAPEAHDLDDVAQNVAQTEAGHL